MALTDEFLTREALAEEFGVSVRTLDRWHHLREGPARTTVGRKPLYRKMAVLDWLAAREEAFPIAQSRWMGK